MKKLPNNKTTEELLKDLETDSKEESLNEKIQHEEDSILTFLSFYNIQPGNERIKNNFLINRIYINLVITKIISKKNYDSYICKI